MNIPGPGQSLMLSCLDTPDLVRYSHVSKAASLSVSNYATIAFQLHRCIANFMSEDAVTALREMLRSTGSIISGDVALRFFSRQLATDCALDIYVDRYNAAETFAFILSLGYVYLPRDNQETALDEAFHEAIDISNALAQDRLRSQDAVLDVFAFEHFAAESRVINVVLACHSPIDAVLDLPCTVEMNIITHAAAYSLYPRGTFAAKTGVCFHDAVRGPGSRYRHTGWDLRSCIESRSYAGLGEEVTIEERYVGDQFTWVINFEKQSDLHLDTALFHSWNLVWSGLQFVRLMPRISRQFYVDPRDPLLTRVFSSMTLVRKFADTVLAIDPSRIVRTDAEVMQAVVRCGADSTFAVRLPSAADTRFIIDARKDYSAIRGVPQLALRSYGPVDLLQYAYDEREPASRSSSSSNGQAADSPATVPTRVGTVSQRRWQATNNLLEFGRDGGLVRRKFWGLPPFRDGSTI